VYADIETLVHLVDVNRRDVAAPVRSERLMIDGNLVTEEIYLHTH
jgi:hypothetical protein